MPFTPGQSNPAPLQSFRFNVEPGKSVPFDGYGDFACIAEASAPLEIAVDDNTNFSPWDTALPLEYNPPHHFRRIAIRNPGVETLTDLLFTGFARINDHRLHQLGEQKVSIEQLSTSVYENTVDLADTTWHTVAASTAQIREVWLAVERVDGDEEAVIPRAWWRASFGPDNLAPSREIGLALDGITRLPFSGTIQVATNAAISELQNGGGGGVSAGNGLAMSPSGELSVTGEIETRNMEHKGPPTNANEPVDVRVSFGWSQPIQPGTRTAYTIKPESDYAVTDSGQLYDPVTIDFNIAGSDETDLSPAGDVTIKPGSNVYDYYDQAAVYIKRPDGTPALMVNFDGVHVWNVSSGEWVKIPGQD
jgi:hypothetical protein